MAPPTAARNSRLTAVAGQMPPGSDDHPIGRRGVEHAVASVRRNGVAVIDAVLDPDTVVAVAKHVRALVMAEVEARMAEVESLVAAGETRIDVWPEEQGVVHLCLDVDDDRFQPLVTHPVAVAVAVALLGTEVEVAGLSLRVPLPGFGHQGLHQDIESPPDPATWEMVRITWVLTPFTVESGTFRYIPGSHLTGPPTETGVGMPPHPDEVRVVASPGAIVLKSAHVWHSGTFNGGLEPRLSVDADYRHQPVMER